MTKCWVGPESQPKSGNDFLPVCQANANSLSFSLFPCLKISSAWPKTLYLHLVVSCWWRHLTGSRQYVYRKAGERHPTHSYWHSNHSDTLIKRDFSPQCKQAKPPVRGLYGCTHLAVDTRCLNPQFSLWTCRSGPDSPFFHGTLPFPTLQTAPANPPSHRQLRCERLHEWVRVSGWGPSARTGPLQRDLVNWI